MFSMTGYGRSTAELDGRQLTVEMKSVNHRFLDISVKLPRAISFAEDTIKKCVSDRLKRGHVEVSVAYINAREDARIITVDEALAKQYYAAAESIKEKLDVLNDCTAGFLLQMPDVVNVTLNNEDTEAVCSLARNACNDALDEMVRMRRTEGENLEKDLAEHLQLLENLRDRIEQLAPEVPKNYRERLINRLNELDIQGDDARIAQETAIMADKCAIDEELSRLASHIAQMRGTFETEGETGKKLDFLTQELNRECNTIGSKASDARITALVVSAKCEVEKIREQVQNVE